MESLETVAGICQCPGAFQQEFWLALGPDSDIWRRI